MKPPFLEALLKELEQNRDYLSGQKINTIYFGGGTPSLLSSEEMNQILATIHRTFNVVSDTEITLEANPDDLSEEYLAALSKTPVNRLSIGVQSFYDEDLVALNRAHDASQVIKVMNRMPDAGCRISVDLIYGIPGLPDDRWMKNLETAIKYGIPHISAYALTVEQKTALHWMIGKGKYPPVSEEQAARQYTIMVELLKEAGYEHYEISNFCKPGEYSRHNTSYWKGVPYLGVGPSAHSYNGTSRRWNISNISLYANMINDGNVAFEEEVLTLTQRYNEYVMTGLRTMWGCDGEYIQREFGPVYQEHFLKCAAKYLTARSMWHVAGKYGLTEEGMLFADGIAADFFMARG